MSNTIPLSQTQYESLSERLDKMEEMIKLLLRKLETTLDFEPTYGSNAWWKWGMQKGDEAIKKGHYVEVSTKKQLDSFFKSL